MTPDEREEFDAMKVAIAEIRTAWPDVITAVHAQSAQSGEQTATNAAVDRELARVSRAIDYPEHLDAVRAKVSEVARRQDATDARHAGGGADWHDNAERGFGTLMASTPGRILAAAVFMLALGAVVVLGILAYKGDLKPAIRGAVTSGTSLEVVPADTTDGI